MGRDAMPSGGISADNGREDKKQCGCNNRGKNNKALLWRREKEEVSETTIIITGNWENIQKATGNECERKVEKGNKCQSCREKEEPKNGKETKNHKRERETHCNTTRKMGRRGE